MSTERWWAWGICFVLAVFYLWMAMEGLDGALESANVFVAAMFILLGGSGER